MAKIRPARPGRRKSKAASWARGIPCLIVLLAGFLLLTLLLTSVLSTGVK